MTDDRVWLCALDLDEWEQVAPLLHPAAYPSPRLPEDARIASAATDALIRVAIHEIAGPDVDPSALLNPEALRKDTSLPFDAVHYSVSHAPHALTVAVSLSPVGVDIEPVADTVDWRPLSHGLVAGALRAPDLRAQSARTAYERARLRAATKASGEAMPVNQGDLPPLQPGWCHLGGSDIHVHDVSWRRDHAVAVASHVLSAPVVLETTASQVLERWRETTQGVGETRRHTGSGSGSAAHTA
ncbi:hypothetical protein [Solicola sp. PLA-1-18]|jgi:hypothetical protein|uniref:hypothetical protein n=1 Tax=Solicola sp. PLA-1-18 TaxID=3380532 RepID=UPI003B7D1266